MTFNILFVALVACTPRPLLAAEQQARGSATANPVRKVVTMLQAMQKKVTAEGEKEAELYKKFMCYCKTNGNTLDASIGAAETKIPAVQADIEEAESQLESTKEALKQAQADRAAAKSALAEATAIREKEAAAFATLEAEYNANIAAIRKAVAALEKGMAGGFLQTGAAKVLRKLIANKQDMMDEDRQQLDAFLSVPWGAGYGAQSGQITGILKEMGDEMARSLSAAMEAEHAAIIAYKQLSAAKTKEINALTASIEAKTKKIGELGVAIVEMKDDLSDTQKALIDDKKFLADLEKGCATKTAEWEVIVKTRSEELAALADTIKILNDDDALELFKKTLPSASASFVQVEVTTKTLRTRALASIRQAAQAAGRPNRAQLDLIALALTGKKVEFGKVIKMIDDMVALLKQEQVDDNSKKEYCLLEFDTSDDKKKALERKLADENAAIASAQKAIETLTEEIAALEAGIAALDKAVMEATDQRKEENADYKELMASDTAAKELLGIAKNRLNKFYNPKLYNAPAKTELSAEGRIEEEISGSAAPTPPPGGIANTGVTALSQVSAHAFGEVAPPPPPETFGAYQKKGEAATGVIEMIDLLIADLDKEMTEATTTEKDAQADYAELMQDSAEKRTADSKSLSDKVATKTDTEADLAALKGSKADTTKELAATLQYIVSLHAECDWLLKYFEVRKEARAGEVQSLVDAKAVLSGADYSLL